MKLKLAENLSRKLLKLTPGGRVPAASDFESWVEWLHKEAGCLGAKLEPTTFAESQALRVMARCMDGGRYSCPLMFVGFAGSFVPAYAAACGNEVHHVAAFGQKDVRFQVLLRLGLGMTHDIWESSFPSWSPVRALPQFVGVLFEDIGSQFLGEERTDWHTDAGDTQSLVKARSMKAGRGVVMVTARVMDWKNADRDEIEVRRQAEEAARRHQTRVYLMEDVEGRLFQFCESTIRQGNRVRDPDSDLTVWTVR